MFPLTYAADSLEPFSKAVNTQLKIYNVPKEKAARIHESIKELETEVKSIEPEKDIDIEKKEKIESKITNIANIWLDILPESAETLATFTRLAPFSKIIGKAVEEIIKELLIRKHK